MKKQTATSTIASSQYASLPSNGEVVQRYVAYLDYRKIEQSTINGIKKTLYDFNYLINDKPFATISKTDIRNFMLHKIKTGVWQSDTIYRAEIGRLSKFFDFLIYEDIVAKNFFKKIRMPKENIFARTSKPRMPLTDDELEKVCRVADLPVIPIAHRTLFFVLLSGGMRAGEVMQLKKEYVDLTRNLIYIPHFIAKGKKISRLVPISPKANAYLKEYIIHLSNIGISSEYLFINERTGGPISYGHVYVWLRNIFYRALTDKHSGYSSHVLRHTFFSKWAEVDGCNMIALRVVGGWSNFITPARYINTSQKFLMDNLKKTGKILWGKIRND